MFTGQYPMFFFVFVFLTLGNLSPRFANSTNTIIQLLQIHAFCFFGAVVWVVPLPSNSIVIVANKGL